VVKLSDIAFVLGQFNDKSYWTRENTLEFIAFMAKLVIIIPGLLFGVQWWWLYLIAMGTSGILVMTSTIKTLPTIIVFNLIWIALAATSICKHFL
jgi:hypothetical protein